MIVGKTRRGLFGNFRTFPLFRVLPPIFFSISSRAICFGEAQRREKRRARGGPRSEAFTGSALSGATARNKETETEAKVQHTTGNHVRGETSSGQPFEKGAFSVPPLTFPRKDGDRKREESVVAGDPPFLSRGILPSPPHLLPRSSALRGDEKIKPLRSPATGGLRRLPTPSIFLRETQLTLLSLVLLSFP